MKCDLTLINLENRGEKKNIQWCISKTQHTKHNKTKQEDCLGPWASVCVAESIKTDVKKK